MEPHKSLPSIIIVHGSWHIPEHYSRFIEGIREAGFEVFCPLLPSCDKTKHAIADLHTDAEIVQRVIQPLVDSGKDVILVMHSSGGVVGTEAAKGFSKQERAAGGAVTHLIYMCGFMLQVGGTIAEASLPRPVPEPVVRNDDGTSIPRLAVIDTFYADVEPQYAKHLESLLVSHCGRTRTRPITHPAWNFIPTTYIRTGEDKALFPQCQDAQIKAVQDAGVSLNVKRFNCSHSPFASIPDQMVRVIQEIVLG